MRVLLLHSERAGHGRLSKAGLVRTFERAGHEARYRSTHEPHWKRELSRAEVVVAIGGDGTVTTVALALAKRREPPPLAVIPSGKANNIARALGVSSSPARLAAALEDAARTRLAIGLIRGPWGQSRFVESAGLGPLGTLFRTDLPTLRAALRFVRVAFRRAPAHQLRVRADGRDLSGRYLMVHGMNIDAAGPRIPFAPRADAADDHLDLVLLAAEQQPAFDRYLRRLAAGKRGTCPLESIRARRIEIGPWPGRDDAHWAGHIDDKPWPDEKRPKWGRVHLEVETRIAVLLPVRDR